MAATPWWTADAFAARRPYLLARAAMTTALRGYFAGQGFTEVETPALQVSPGLEPHLRAFATQINDPYGGPARPMYLHTSPEFAMKKLLAGGVGRCFQLARVWRNGEGSDLHAPEFTMLEWYRPGGTMDDLIEETFALLQAVLPPVVTCRGITVSLEGFECLTVAEAFSRHVGADLLGTLDDAPTLAAQAGVRLREGEDWEDLELKL